jgi:hypothetical protein
MIYLVLGMHKSGTTLVAQALHESGINMGEFDESLDYDSSNKYERHTAQEINRAMLDGLLIPPLGYLLRARNRPLYDQAGYRRNKDSLALVRYRAFQRRFRDTEPEEMKALIERLASQHQDWGFKDPRTCLTYPVWRRVLPPHRLVVVYRHFSQLIERYRVTGWNIPRLYHVLYSWTLHNQLVCGFLAETDQPHIVLSYERLMVEHQEYDRLRSFVDADLVDVRDPDLYRRRTGKNEDLFGSLVRMLSPFLPANPRQVYRKLETYRAQAIT